MCLIRQKAIKYTNYERPRYFILNYKPKLEMLVSFQRQPEYPKHLAALNNAWRGKKLF